MFQSSPGLVTGRYKMKQFKGIKELYVSILARSGDRALRSVIRVSKGDIIVSILARSGDRALPPIHQLLHYITKFQSSPGLVTGRYNW